MSWREWIRTVEVEPSLDACAPAAAPARAESLLRAGCRVVGLTLDGDLAGAARLELLAPIVHRLDGVLDIMLAGAASPSACGALAAAGADSVTFELELVADPQAMIDAARSAAIQVGIAFSTVTPPERAATLAAGADLLRCPGGTLDEQLRRVRLLARVVPPTLTIQAGGGIDHDTIREYYQAGARVLLVGRAIFEREDLPRAYRRLVQALA
jgi:pentose-5-phosphate-3-epimerase